MGPLLPQLVASAMWDLCRLRYMRPLSSQFVASATCDLLPPLHRLRYVYLFQTGLAQGHAPALLQDRSSLRARTYPDSIVAMR